MTTPADLAALAAGPTDAEVRHRYLAGRWPTAAELVDLERRHQADPAIRRQPLADVLHALLGAADRRAG